MVEQYGPDYFREQPGDAEFKRLWALPLEELLKQVEARHFRTRGPVWEVVKLRADLQQCGWMLYAIAIDEGAGFDLRCEATSILRAKLLQLQLNAYKTAQLDYPERKKKLEELRSALEEQCGPRPG
jgi:hypothetical protein